MLSEKIKEILKTNQFQATLLETKESQEYIGVSPEGLTAILAALKDIVEVYLIDLWAVEGWQGKGLSLCYAFAVPGEPVVVLAVNLPGREAVSVAASFPVAAYLERIVHDGFGIEFKGAFDTRRMSLHEAYPEDFHPMLKSFRGKDIPASGNALPYPFKEFDGEGIYQVPVGPVHAGIIEPGHFRFSVIGETIFNLEIRHFYKYRGLEKLAEGMPVEEAVRVAETISGDESAANACAYALAIERITGISAPRRAWKLRTLLLELERIYSHLGDLAGMAVDVAYPVGATPFFVLREEILRWNAELTGSRFLKGIFVPGGLSHELLPEKLAGFERYCAEFLPRLEKALETIFNSTWVIDRFETTGVVKKELTRPLSLSGPTARASGSLHDTRIDQPYGLYRELGLSTMSKSTGDVLARFQLKAEEIKESMRVIQTSLTISADGPILKSCPAKNGYALTLVESARGQSLHWVNVRDGRIDRYHVRTASFCNWLAIEHAVLGNIIPDFPLINKSLNLSYAGNDL